MGVLFSIVPIVYCCETSTDNEPDEPLKPHHEVHHEMTAPKRTSDPGKRAIAPVEPPRKITDPDTRAWIEKFQAFVEKPSVTNLPTQ